MRQVTRILPRSPGETNVRLPEVKPEAHGQCDLGGEGGNRKDTLQYKFQQVAAGNSGTKHKPINTATHLGMCQAAEGQGHKNLR